MTSSADIARRIQRLRHELDRIDGGSSAISRALDDAGRALDHLCAACGDDEALALRLGSSRAVATSYVRATTHLREAGARPDLCEVVLEEGRLRLADDLADVQRSLRSVQAAGGR